MLELEFHKVVRNMWQILCWKMVTDGREIKNLWSEEKVGILQTKWPLHCRPRGWSLGSSEDCDDQNMWQIFLTLFRVDIIPAISKEASLCSNWCNIESTMSPKYHWAWFYTLLWWQLWHDDGDDSCWRWQYEDGITEYDANGGDGNGDDDNDESENN